MDNHIFIYGDIGSEEGQVSLHSIKSQYKPGAKKVIVVINSDGGEVKEGRAIYDFLKEIPQEVHTIGEGMVASIATLPFLAGTTREMKPNCEFLGHLPSIGGVAGNSDDIQRVSDYMQEKKRDIAGIYSQFTGKDLEEMVDFMRLDTPISSSKAKAMGFVTYIPEFKAVAYYKLNKTDEMSKEEEVKPSKLDKIMAKMDAQLGKIEKLIFSNNADAAVENVVIDLADGAKIFVNSEDGELEGKAVFMADEEGNSTDEALAAGVYELNDGRSITVSDEGIVESVQEVAVDEEKEAMKVELENLKAELATSNEAKETLTNQLEEVKNSVTEVTTELTNMKKVVVGSIDAVPKAHIKPEDKSVEKEVVTSSLEEWGMNLINR